MMRYQEERDPQLYFDTVDGMLAQEGFEIWLSEPQSVEERRLKFLSRIGISEDDGSSCSMPNGGLELLERISQCSEAAETSSSFSEGDEESSVCLWRECVSEANSLADDDTEEEVVDGRKAQCGSEGEASTSVAGFDDEVHKANGEKVKLKSWWSWKKFASKKRAEACEVPSKANRLAKVKCNKKKYMELTGLFLGQEIQAHKGIIWTMKFSPDGQYLATGGEDGMVRIWRVGATADPSAKAFTDQASLKLSVFGSKKGSHDPFIVIPEKVFQIEQSPLHEFCGHTSDVLDLAWSSSNLLLSSSKDKTVRLWQVGYNHCLNVYHHGNYVTCIQFNPVNENYFISGSIDGKVRIWGVNEARVIDWTDVRNVISAICYRPDGKEFVVGSIRGTCRFYDLSEQDMQLEAEIHIRGRKSSNRITGIQFSQETAPKVMITSEDSKVRIFDGFDLVQKFKGLPRSGSQMSGSFTSAGKHIISVGEDCQVYVWNYHNSSFCSSPSSKHIKSEQSMEHFTLQGVSVAIPWPGTSSTSSDQGSFLGGHHQRSRVDVTERFSLGSWCQPMDGGSFRGSSAATWPEERLPAWDVGEVEEECGGGDMGEAWGMVIVTASCDGKISTFSNYGLPMLL